MSMSKYASTEDWLNDFTKNEADARIAHLKAKLASRQRLVIDKRETEWLVRYVQYLRNMLDRL